MHVDKPTPWSEYACVFFFIIIIKLNKNTHVATLHNQLSTNMTTVMQNALHKFVLNFYLLKDHQAEQQRVSVKEYYSELLLFWVIQSQAVVQNNIIWQLNSTESQLQNCANFLGRRHRSNPMQKLVDAYNYKLRILYKYILDLLGITAQAQKINIEGFHQFLIISI